jgi:hypothetical protein
MSENQRFHNGLTKREWIAVLKRQLDGIEPPDRQEGRRRYRLTLTPEQIEQAKLRMRENKLAQEMKNRMSQMRKNRPKKTEAERKALESERLQSLREIEEDKWKL